MLAVKPPDIAPTCRRFLGVTGRQNMRVESGAILIGRIPVWTDPVEVHRDRIADHRPFDVEGPVCGLPGKVC